MGKRSTRDGVGIITHKATKKTKASSFDVKSKEMDDKKVMDGRILKVMLKYHMEERFNVKAKDVADELGCHDRTKTFQKRWSIMKNKRNFFGPGEDGGLKLTKEGLEEAATPEYKEMMKELSMKPKTGKEHQDRIKKYLKKPKCGAIFDFLLEYGSLTREELSALVGQNTRSHGFSDSMRELRVKNYVQKDPNAANKLCLSDKCFLKGKESGLKDNAIIDTKKLAAEVAKGRALIESRRKGSKTSINTKVKNEKSVKSESKNLKKEEAMKEEVVKEETIDDVQKEDEIIHSDNGSSEGDHGIVE